MNINKHIRFIIILCALIAGIAAAPKVAAAVKIHGMVTDENNEPL